MTKHNTLEEKLTYPIDYYFPSNFFSTFTDEERVIASKAYEVYVKDCYQQATLPSPKHKVFKAQMAILEEDRKSNYFETVRTLLNVLLSKAKNVEDLYLAFFPDRDSQVSYFQQQILDTVYLYQHRNEFDLDTMNLSWNKFYQDDQHKMENFVSKMNWFPAYWDFNEKNKLFDYWRYRYYKNMINFSPSKEHIFGGMGFFDPSYVSMKEEYQNNEVSIEIEKMRKNYIERRKYLEQEQKHSQIEDRFRLQILMSAEEASFNYWLSKKIYPVIEHGDAAILKESLSIIDTKERIFKLWLGILIEYDRTFYSPLSYPDRNVAINPLNITEAHYWLTRNGREVQSAKDSSIFLKYQKSIRRYDRLVERSKPFLPSLLIDRHEKSLVFEQNYNIQRSANGEYIDEKENKTYFCRPHSLNIKINNLEDTRQELEQQIDSIIDTTIGIKHINVLANQAVQVQEKQQGEKNLPKENPYLILHEKLFSIFLQQNPSEKERVFEELEKYIEQHKKQDERFVKKDGKRISLFFFMDKHKRVREKFYPNEQSKPILFNISHSDLIYEQDYVLINGKDLKSEGFADLKTGQVDEFDDKTRFDSKFLGILGRALNVQAVAQHLLKQSEHIVEFSEKIKAVIDKKIVAKVKLGLETAQQRADIKRKMQDRYNLDNFIEVRQEQNNTYQPK